MESSYLHNLEIALNILTKLIEACDYIMLWNRGIKSENDYLTSPKGMEKMAASYMLLESIGEGIKKIDKLLPDFLKENEPETPWRQIKGLRDHIAHGYFELDASTIYDVAINEVPELKEVLSRLKQKINL